MKQLIIFIPLLIVMGQGCGAAEANTLMQKRQQMVNEEIERRGIKDQHVLDAMRKVKRHLFVPDDLQDSAYDDRPLPIGYGQTISQPYIVAFMTEAGKIEPDDRVLEIGTGSGYQAAVLGEMAKEVYTIEILKPLAENSRQRLDRLGYRNIKVKHGDGYKGWPQYAPYDCIIVTAAPPELPKELLKQLKVGGRMVIPVGSFFQDLYLITRTDAGYQKKVLLPVRFVPMVHPSIPDK
ncbi:MAG: protein-L-isoaspartate(D-aspartate) O-methyltransferase [Deltaproteobacteria bacterium]|nr:protein-L-isoaspartate(D-aspartate) O-methyltransferase [Deltaproteobacteria bacterium]